METNTFELPMMFGDHHVLEVRRILLEMPGMIEVYASSAFQVVEVSFDESKLDPDKILSALTAVGYTGELPGLIGNGSAGYDRRSVERRRTGLAAGEQEISFLQDVPSTGNKIWPCPGLGTLNSEVNDG